MPLRLAGLVAVLCLVMAGPLPALSQEQSAVKPAPARPAKAEPPAISDATQGCLGCHETATPGIVADWRKSRMARTTPARALAAAAEGRRISVKLEAVPQDLRQVAVGCAECHTMNPEKHPASFDHEGNQVHTVVSPPDCATCHPTERDEYGQNLMSHAWLNMTGNPIYRDLMRNVNGVQVFKNDGMVSSREPTEADSAESCLFCHGTEVTPDGTRTISTEDFGDIQVTRLNGWPNRGVGRKNPDGTMGSCTACHTRHQFSMAFARKPAACAQCHKGPDVPAYKVYDVSKHGNLYRAMGQDWNFDNVPWVLGQDFQAPTCAACHISGVSDPSGNQVARRSHRMNDRLWWRLLGLIYSHPHPKSPDTTIITNANGMSLATTLDGKPAEKFLIGPEEQKERKQRMHALCLSCHSTAWVEGQAKGLEASIKASDAEVLTATQILQEIWRLGLAQGLPDASPFDEYIEAVWIESWLFHGNSVRMASAMMGADMGVFENGRWQQALTVRRMHDWLRWHGGQGPKKAD